MTVSLKRRKWVLWEQSDYLTCTCNKGEKNLITLQPFLNTQKTYRTIEMSIHR